QPAREPARRVDRRVRHQPADAAGHVVQQVQFAGRVLAEAYQPQAGVVQLAVVADRLLLAVVAERPDAAGVVVAVDVGPGQLVTPPALVAEPACDRAEVGVAVFDDRNQDRRRPARPLRPERVAAFQHAPAVVAAALDAVNLFPQVLADVAGPQVPRGAV